MSADTVPNALELGDETALSVAMVAVANALRVASSRDGDAVREKTELKEAVGVAAADENADADAEKGAVSLAVIAADDVGGGLLL